MAKACQWCGSTYHTQFYCFKKPRKPIARKGKKAKRWDKAKNEWNKINPPDEYGFWYCTIGGSRLSKDNSYGSYTLNIDHDISRVRDSTKIDDQDNLNALCPRHNRLKGSMSLEEFIDKIGDKMCGNY